MEDEVEPDGEDVKFNNVTVPHMLSSQTRIVLQRKIGLVFMPLHRKYSF